MKQQLHAVFAQAVQQLKNKGIIPVEQAVTIQFERTRQKEHGDFACNIAMTLAKSAKKNPRELAQAIVAALPDDPVIKKVDIAGLALSIFLFRKRHVMLFWSLFFHRLKNTDYLKRRVRTKKYYWNMFLPTQLAHCM